ncbi:MAG: transporter substrate-binding domain-containing protein [Alphaproteobacteria bacterium]|nr:transporter substrate-binding domain-containing protein [Alphaproteobacteria bacterium]
MSQIVSPLVSVIEKTQYMGTMVAIEEINQAGGINGRELVATTYDPASDNNLFRSYSRKMLVEDGLSTIFGCYSSSSRRAVLPIVERMNGLLWYPTQYEGFECSPNVIYTGASSNQNSVALADYIATNFGRRVYFVGVDYVFPRETNRIMRQLLVERGCEVVAEMYVPTRARREDFFPIFNDIKQLRPDAIFSTVVGDATARFYQMYADQHFSAKQMPIFSLTTTESENLAMGADVAEDHFTVAAYFQTVESDQNQAFVRRCRLLYGDDINTNVCMEAAYYQVHVFKKALELAGSMDTDVLRPALKGLALAAPQGPVTIHQRWRHSNVWSRVGRAMRSGQFSIVSQSRSAVECDPFFLRASQAS